MRLALLLLTACHLSTSPIRSLDVHIKSVPPRPSCFVPDAPVPPVPLELDFEQLDVVRRSMVNIRQFNDLIYYLIKVSDWVDGVNRCLEEFSGDPQIP